MEVGGKFDFRGGSDLWDLWEEEEKEKKKAATYICRWQLLRAGFGSHHNYQ